MWLVIFFIFLNVSLVSAMDMEVRSVKKHTKDDLSIFLERRVIDVHSERDAEEMGQRPRFVRTVFNASMRSRELRENSAFEDARHLNHPRTFDVIQVTRFCTRPSTLTSYQRLF